MSAIASFYLLRKDKFSEFCKMARLVPKDNRKPPRRLTVAKGPREEVNSPEARKLSQYYNSLWNYLSKNARVPFEYPWSGYVLGALLSCLKQMKNIDLMQVTFEPEDEVWEWWLLNQELKDKYLLQLDPSNYTEKQLKEYYQAHSEHQKQEHLKGLQLLLPTKSKDFSKKEIEEMIEMIKSEKTDYSDAGRAMMDGVKIIYKYLKLVDENSVVLFHIG
jgi:hypothetical protein